MHICCLSQLLFNSQEKNSKTKGTCCLQRSFGLCSLFAEYFIDKTNIESNISGPLGMQNGSICQKEEKKKIFLAGFWGPVSMSDLQGWLYPSRRGAAISQQPWWCASNQRFPARSSPHKLLGQRSAHGLSPVLPSPPQAIDHQSWCVCWGGGGQCLRPGFRTSRSIMELSRTDRGWRWSLCAPPQKRKKKTQWVIWHVDGLWVRRASLISARRVIRSTDTWGQLRGAVTWARMNGVKAPSGASAIEPGGAVFS